MACRPLRRAAGWRRGESGRGHVVMAWGDAEEPVPRGGGSLRRRTPRAVTRRTRARGRARPLLGACVQCSTPVGGNGDKRTTQSAYRATRVPDSVGFPRCRLWCHQARRDLQAASSDSGQIVGQRLQVREVTGIRRPDRCASGASSASTSPQRTGAECADGRASGSHARVRLSSATGRPRRSGSPRDDSSSSSHPPWREPGALDARCYFGSGPGFARWTFSSASLRRPVMRSAE